MIARGLAILAIACGAPRVEIAPMEPAQLVERPRTCTFETSGQVSITEWDARGRVSRTEVRMSTVTSETVTLYEGGVAETRMTGTQGTEPLSATERLRFEIAEGSVVVRVQHADEWLVRERLWLDDEGRVTRVQTNASDLRHVTRCVREEGRLASVRTHWGLRDREGVDTVQRISYDAEGRLAEIEVRRPDVYRTSVRYEGARAIVSSGISDDDPTITTADCVDVWLYECAPTYRIAMPERSEQRAALDDAQDVREAYARATGDILEDHVVVDRDAMPGAILFFDHGELLGAFVGGEYLYESALPARGLALLGYARAGDAQSELALAWIRNVRSRNDTILESAPDGWPASRGEVSPPAISQGEGGSRVVSLWEQRPSGRQPVCLRWQHTIDPSGAIYSRLLEHYEGTR